MSIPFGESLPRSYCCVWYYYNNIITVSIKYAYIALLLHACNFFLLLLISSSSIIIFIIFRKTTQIERTECHSGVDCCCSILNMDSRPLCVCTSTLHSTTLSFSLSLSHSRLTICRLRKMSSLYVPAFVWPKNLWAYRECPLLFSSGVQYACIKR